jgi:hypothetical protein
MPFIGKTPETGAFRLIDSITTSATDTYALTVEGDHYFPESARNLIVSLNGVTQAPEAAYTVSGSHIVFASALTSSDVIDYILVIGEAVDIGTPSDNTVGNAQLKSSLDLSGKTLTFSADQVSGDAIDGGTISNFASTGIGDNASATVMTVAGGSSGSNSIIQSVNSNYGCGFYGSSANFGFEITDGGVGGKTIRIKNNSTDIFFHNQVHNIIDMSNASSVTVAGFTSTGIDDNANATAITIDSSENVGIGTGASISAPLHIGRAASGTYSIFDDGVNGRFTFSSVTGTTNENRIFSTTTGFAGYEDLNIVGDNLLFSTGGPTGVKMKVASDGKVGIGTSPLNLLTLKSGSQYQGLAILNGSGGLIGELVGFASGNDSGGLKLWSGGSAKVNLLSNGGSYLAGGNVSIGTTTTTKGRLTVEGVSPANNNNTLALVSAAGSSKKAGISFYGTFTLPTTDTSPRRAADITAGFSTHNWGTEYMAFHVGTGATNDVMAPTTERVRIDGQGRFLVGATDIASNVKAVIQGAQGQEALRLTNASGGSGNVQGGTYLGLHHWNSTSAGGAVHSSVQIGAVETSVADYDAHLVFKTRSSNADVAPTERVRINDTGKVAIGISGMSQGGSGPLQVYSASGSQLILGKGNGAPSISFGSPTVQYGLIEAVSAGGFKFYTGNGTLSLGMTLDSGGNFNIGGSNSRVDLNADGTVVQVHSPNVVSTSLFGAIAGVSNGFSIVTNASNKHYYTWLTGPVVGMTLDTDGYLSVPKAYAATTSGAANLHILSNGAIVRSVSSIKYKTEVEDAWLDYAKKLYDLRPVYYKSLGEFDNPDWSYWGFIAEEVAEVDARLAQFKTTEISYDENNERVETQLAEPEVEGVQYDRMVPLLLMLIKDQKEQSETLKAELATLKAEVSALKGA